MIWSPHFFEDIMAT